MIKLMTQKIRWVTQKKKPFKNDILNEEKNKEKPTNEIPSDIANDVRKKIEENHFQKMKALPLRELPDELKGLLGNNFVVYEINLMEHVVQGLLHYGCFWTNL